MTEISLLILLTIGLAANVAWTVYLFRRGKSRPAGLGDARTPADLDTHLERFLSEIHRVTNANVELLEGRIDALREVGGLADERLKRLRASLTDLEVLLNRVQRVKKAITADAQTPATDDGPGEEEVVAEPLGAPRRSMTKLEVARTLARQGLTERQIAQKMDLGIAEIRILLKLSGAAQEVESR